MLDSCLAKIFQDCEEINRNLKETQESQVFEAESVEQNTYKSKSSVNNKSKISSKSKDIETDEKARKEVSEPENASVLDSIEPRRKRKKTKVDDSKNRREIQKGSRLVLLNQFQKSTLNWKR